MSALISSRPVQFTAITIGLIWTIINIKFIILSLFALFAIFIFYGRLWLADWLHHSIKFNHSCYT